MIMKWVVRIARTEEKRREEKRREEKRREEKRREEKRREEKKREKCVQYFDQKTGMNNLGDVCADGRIILKGVF
jgi:hypothetical protein